MNDLTRRRSKCLSKEKLQYAALVLHSAHKLHSEDRATSVLDRQLRIRQARRYHPTREPAALFPSPASDVPCAPTEVDATATGAPVEAGAQTRAADGGAAALAATATGFVGVHR